MDAEKRFKLQFILLALSIKERCMAGNESADDILASWKSEVIAMRIALRVASGRSVVHA